MVSTTTGDGKIIAGVGSGSGASNFPTGVGVVGWVVTGWVVGLVLGSTTTFVGVDSTGIVDAGGVGIVGVSVVVFVGVVVVGVDGVDTVGVVVLVGVVVGAVVVGVDGVDTVGVVVLVGVVVGAVVVGVDTVGVVVLVGVVVVGADGVDTIVGDAGTIATPLLTATPVIPPQPTVGVAAAPTMFAWRPRRPVLFCVITSKLLPIFLSI